MIRALIWKEWCEQRWKLAFGCVLIGGFTAVALRARILPDELAFLMATGIAAVAMPVFVSMGVFACEKEEGTLGMLLALPVRKLKVYAAKMVTGATICAGPIVLAAILTILMAAGRERSAEWIARECAKSIAGALTTYVWVATFSARQSSEAKAGLVAIAVLLVFAGTGFLGAMWAPRLLAALVTPQIQSVIVGVLLLWGGWRFGKERRAEK